MIYFDAVFYGFSLVLCEAGGHRPQAWCIRQEAGADRLTASSIMHQGVPFGLHREQVVFIGFYLDYLRR